jgi:diguanylate cyclase (GGDEF)-like protein/PAS domain S-box-containing protein
VRDQVSAGVPIIVVCESVTEVVIADAMSVGARDVVSLASADRLHAVMVRELRAFRLERALGTTVKSAHDARRQLESVLQRSNDAIVQVQEGIVVDANPAWLELHGNPETLIGTPVMDLFEESNHAALKGALAACLQGRWNDHTLKVSAVLADGSTFPVEIVLALGEHEGEPSVRLVVPARTRDESKLAAEVTEAIHSDASTGFLHRRELLEALTQRFASPAAGGVRHLALVKIDKFSSLEHDVGATASEEILIEFSRVLKDTLHPKEIIGRLGGVRFLALLERGNERDVDAWSEQLLSRLQKHVTRVKDKALTVTCTVGLAVVPHGAVNLDAAIADAVDACKRGGNRGGNQVVVSDKSDADTRVQSTTRCG